MRPRAFLEPFVSRKSRGTGHLASSCLQRNGHETVRTPAGSRVLFVSSSTIYSREQITRTSPTSSSNLFIYYFLFFEEKEKEARKTSAPPANHSWHTQTTQNSIQAHRCFELGRTWKFVLLVFRDTYIHFLRAERRIINRSKGKILLLELLY